MRFWCEKVCEINYPSFLFYCQTGPWYGFWIRCPWPCVTLANSPKLPGFFFRVLSHVWKEGAEPEIHYDHFQFLMSIILQNEKGIKYVKKKKPSCITSSLKYKMLKHVQFFKNILLFSILVPCFAGWSQWISEELRGPISRSSGVINSSGWS